jgi:hypothetical protein
LELAGGGEDPIFGFLRNGVSDRRAVHHQRDRRGRELKVIRQKLQRNFLMGQAFLPGWHDLRSLA